jgi:putative phosphoesterase
MFSELPTTERTTRRGGRDGAGPREADARSVDSDWRRTHGTMRVALLSDVHANAVALRAVLEEITEADPDTVVCAGDVVGYGPDPATCLALIRDAADVVVCGNHDRNAGTPGRYAGHPTAGPGLEHTAAELDAEQHEWLCDLPTRATLDDGAVLVVHSHPDPGRRGRYVYPEDFKAVGRDVDADVLVLGHTHVQGASEAEGTLVVNPGSVGQPRDGDARAAYALLDTTGPSVDLRRVDYDVDAVREAVEDAGLPEKTWRRLRKGT